MRHLRILILEDDLLTLAKSLEGIYKLEEKLLNSPTLADIAVTVLSEYTQVEEYINNSRTTFDVILLDRDCKAGGSFHVLDTNKINTNSIISISSVPKYNEDAKKLGITRTVHKDYSELEVFVETVMRQIYSIVSGEE